MSMTRNLGLNLNKRQWTTLLILSGLLIFLVVNNYIVFFEDGLVFTDHERYQVGYSYYESLDLHPLYLSPLYHLTTGLLFRLLGPQLSVALITNQILLLVFILYNYKLGKHLFGRKVGILSTVFTVTIPLFFALSRFYNYRFVCVTILPMVIYYMFRSEGFSNARNTALFTISFIVAAYFRQAIVTFVGPLLLLYLFHERERVRENLGRVISMFAVLFVYGFLLIQLFDPARIGSMLQGRPGRPDRTILWNIFEGIEVNRASELLVRLGTQLRPVYLFLFVPTLVYFLYRTYNQGKRFEKLFTLIWLSLPVLIYSQLLSHQHFFQLLPIFIPVSYITSYGVNRLGLYLEKTSNLKGNLLRLSFVTLCLVNFLLISYNVEAYYPEEVTARGSINYEYRYHPREEDYRKIFDEINRQNYPKIGVFIYEIDPREPAPYWPFSYQDISGIQSRLDGGTVTSKIPPESEFRVIHSEENIENDFRKIKQISNILIIATPKRRELSELESELGNSWREIESFEADPATGDSTLSFYRKME